MTAMFRHFLLAAVLAAAACGAGAKPAPVAVSVADILAGRHDSALVRTTGRVREVFQDDIDSCWRHLVLVDGSSSILVSIGRKDYDGPLDHLIDATVEAVCSVVPFSGISRRHSGRSLHLCPGTGLTVVTPARANALDAPRVEDIGNLAPAEVAALGRRRTSGFVLARLPHSRILLRTSSGEVRSIVLADAEPPPIGRFVDVVGFPETDLYTINLNAASWRLATNAVSLTEAPTKDLRPEDLTRKLVDRTNFALDLHGQSVRVRGELLGDPTADGGFTVLQIGFGNRRVNLTVAAGPDGLPGYTSGCRIEAVGVCVVEKENWRPSLMIPRVNGISVAVNDPSDLRILSRPPWWTPRRLGIVIASLLAALIAILVWNVSLRRLADRRGRELYRANAAKDRANLRKEERTRLAVELHDSISQNMTGVSMQIDSAERFFTDDRDKALRHLDIASRTIDSCRQELRNCIYDLRGQALDEPDLNVALRATLQPHLGGARLALEVDVPRKRLTDNTTHAVLRIVRELAVNAVRHGKAGLITVRGTSTDRCCTFTVSDDGCGFDPANRAGIAEGHFGLQGVTERLKTLGGTLRIDSAAGRGTTIAFTLPTGDEQI